jgi:hypothetical protein
MPRKAKLSVDYKPMFGFVVGAHSVAKCNSNVHSVELPDGSIGTLWSDDQLIPIGTRVLVRQRNTDGKLFM